MLLKHKIVHKEFASAKTSSVKRARPIIRVAARGQRGFMALVAKHMKLGRKMPTGSKKKLSSFKHG